MINLIPCVDVENIDKCREHITSEFVEFVKAYDDWGKTCDGKTKAHMVEEAIDCATALLTLVSKATEGKQDVAMLMVACKNYLRGYHDENPIALMESEDLTRNRVRDLETIGSKNE